MIIEHNYFYKYLLTLNSKLITESNPTMRSNKNIILMTGLLTIAVTILPFFAMAQDPGGGSDAPIDGGLSLLLVADMAYGVKNKGSIKRKVKRWRNEN